MPDKINEIITVQENLSGNKNDMVFTFNCLLNLRNMLVYEGHSGQYYETAISNLLDQIETDILTAKGPSVNEAFSCS